jgi:signal transduction histidine kinase
LKLSIHSLTVKLTASISALAAILFVIDWFTYKGGVSGWIVFPISAVIFIAFVFFISRRLIFPLREVQEAADKLTEGDYSARLNITDLGEIGELAQSFNLMADELNHADQMRRDLIANVSHELRTPVAALQALVENMADGVVEPTPSNLNGILDQTHRLSDLIAFLLDLSRVEAGAASLQIERFNFEEFVNDTLAPLQITDAGHAHNVRVSVPSHLFIEADQDRLRQLFTNIISNAMKHSSDQSLILIETHEDSAHGTIITNVVNYGSQISPEDRSTIFRRYVKGIGRAGTSSGGTGLGLSIARWAAGLHGGSVSVVDDERGANFQIELPKYHIAHDASNDAAYSASDPAEDDFA